jgi:uncharacterized protein
MNKDTLQSFPPGVVDKLENYVYRLYDPRNGETFYVGVGKGDRIFAHIRGSKDFVQDEDSDIDYKFKTIHEIHNNGFEVGHVIHRHGMDRSTALQVEAALIDAYPSLTNRQSGHGSGDYGSMHIKQIIERYSAPLADFENHKVILISINRSIETSDIYEAVHFAWVLDPKRAEKADFVLATQEGMIKDVFIAEKWLEATSENFPGRPTIEGRFGFYGSVANDEIRSFYRGKQVPPQYRKRGASNPIKYTWS